jgi:hypothetical protein
MKVDQAHETAWMWSVFIEDRKPGAPYKGHEPTRDAAMQAFAEAWRR